MDQEHGQDQFSEQIQPQDDGTRMANDNPVKNEVWEWVKALLIAAILVFLIRFFIFAPFIVEGPSMEPNFYTNERLIVNKIIYDIRKPKRGEVIVFHAPAGKDYIKRVVGLPGDKVKIENNQVYINGKPLEEPYIQSAIDEKMKAGIKYNNDFQETVVPEGTIFAMGDNRLNSSDSRAPSVGPVPYEKIVGRADIIFWPMAKIQFVKH